MQENLLLLLKIFVLSLSLPYFLGFYNEPFYLFLVAMFQISVIAFYYKKNINPFVTLIPVSIFATVVAFHFSEDMYGPIFPLLIGAGILLGHIAFASLWYFKIFKKNKQGTVNYQTSNIENTPIFYTKVILLISIIPVIIILSSVFNDQVFEIIELVNQSLFSVSE